MDDALVNVRHAGPAHAAGWTLVQRRRQAGSFVLYRIAAGHLGFFGQCRQRDYCSLDFSLVPSFLKTNSQAFIITDFYCFDIIFCVYIYRLRSVLLVVFFFSGSKDNARPGVPPRVSRL